MFLLFSFHRFVIYLYDNVGPPYFFMFNDHYTTDVHRSQMFTSVNLEILKWSQASHGGMDHNHNHANPLFGDWRIFAAVLPVKKKVSEMTPIVK